MNLLVGILCEDGVVVGAADSGPVRSGDPDLLDEPPTNTFVIGDDLIFAGSGRVGLGQRFAEVVTAIRSDSRFRAWTGLSVARTICAEAARDFGSTRWEKGQFGALVAFCCSDGFQLGEFAARDLQPELKTPRRWFATMGTGRSVADPFLRFLQRVFFADSPPGLDAGVFAAIWTLDYAVGPEAGASPGFPQIAVLAREGREMPVIARPLSAVELADRIAEVRACEKHLAAYRPGRSDVG
jgi:hypothetical protein